MEQVTYTMLIWRALLDSVSIYIFPDDHEDIEKIRNCAGLYLNCNAEEHENKESIEYVDTKIGGGDYNNYLQQYSSEDQRPELNKFITHVILAGFYL